MSVTVVSCVYGGHTRFVPRWAAAVEALEPAPAAVIVKGADRCPWRHPQAFYLQRAVEAADTEWVVIADIDDVLLPDALAGLDAVDADVWQFGFERSDGERYIPPTLTATEVLGLDRNVLVGSSAIRTEAFHAAGGFPDVAFQDWGLWRRMARAGMTFESSGRIHFRYMRHDQARGTVELTPRTRQAHLTEMLEAELAAV